MPGKKSVTQRRCLPTDGREPSKILTRFCIAFKAEIGTNCYVLPTLYFLSKNIRTFDVKHRNFVSKKSDVCRFPQGKHRKTAPEWRITPLLHVMQNIRTSHGVVASDGLLKALNAPKILKSVVISLPCRQEHSLAMRRSRSAPVPSLPVSLW